MLVKKPAASDGLFGKWLPATTAQLGAATTLSITFRPAALAALTAPSSGPQPMAVLGAGCSPSQRTCCLTQPKPATFTAFTARSGAGPTSSAPKPYWRPCARLGVPLLA